MLLVVAVLMLVFSLMRKRLFVGIVTAMYGLAIFNLHYWGFGVPFLLVGAWYLVRAYRLQRDLKEASADGSGGGRGRAGGARRPSRPGRRSATRRPRRPRSGRRRPSDKDKDKDSDKDERRTG